MQNIKIEIKWAIIFSVVTLLWMVLEKLVGLHGTHIDKHMIYTNFFAIPAIILVVLALRDKRKNFYNGTMTYKQGLISGLILSVFIALLSPVTQYLISTIISPEYFPNIIEYTVDSGMMSQEAASAAFNLQSYMLQASMGGLIMGILTSAIVAVFLRKAVVA